MKYQIFINSLTMHTHQKITVHTYTQVNFYNTLVYGKHALNILRKAAEYPDKQNYKQH